MKYWIPLFAILGFGIAAITVITGNRDKHSVNTIVKVPQAPFNEYVAGAGILEASTQNIEVGTPVSGIISDVYVKWGDRVKIGDSLFKIDDRDLQSSLVSAKAKVNEAKSVLKKSQYHQELADKLGDNISKEEQIGKRFEVEINNAALKVSKAEFERVQMDIGRRTIRSPIAGRVLNINARAGELASSDAAGASLMVLGNDDSIFVRVEVDENDAWRVRKGARAMAFLRGNPEIQIPVQFQRIEPQVIPKTILNGKSTERTDVRVLQVIYGFNRATWPVYVGQEMDVLIETEPVKSEPK